MGLIACKECKKKISAKAKSCPECGAVPKKQTGCIPMIGCLLLSPLLIFALIIIIGLSVDDTPSPAKVSLPASLETRPKIQTNHEEEPEIKSSPEKNLPTETPNFINPRNLSIGQSYILSRQTPLMPTHSPKDPMAELQKMKQIPKGSVIKVLKTFKKSTTPWYRVIVFRKDRKEIGKGWINSIALVGQKLRETKK